MVESISLVHNARYIYDVINIFFPTQMLKYNAFRSLSMWMTYHSHLI